MPKFNIAVTWQMWGVYKDVEAETREEAQQKVSMMRTMELNWGLSKLSRRRLNRLLSLNTIL